MTPTKLLIGQMLVALGIVVAGAWLATEWVAAQLGFQIRLGPPWCVILNLPVYLPWRFAQWWYVYDSYAPDIFACGGEIVAGSGLLAAVAAVFGSIWRARQARIVTTYGYAWLDTHLGADGRLRGEWTGSDGAAGRMTASAGLHNMPAALRPAVVAADGHVFVRADLGQIEPRVLAAVSGDQALVAAARSDDLYAPVATQLGVDRPVAKVAVLGAMYGQTTGHGAQALRRLNAAYPVAMAYLDAADRAGRAGRDLRTYGGRLIVLAPAPGQEPRSSSRVAAYGRYARNAMIQGAAAELFKMWAVIVRARCGHLGAGIVLCLHDELLVHSPREHAEAVSRLVDDCLREAAQRWAPGCGVRFISDTTIVRSWSDAKNAALDPAGPPG